MLPMSVILKGTQRARNPMVGGAMLGIILRGGLA
jgi:hypothetical protein